MTGDAQLCALRAADARTDEGQVQHQKCDKEAGHPARDRGMIPHRGINNTLLRRRQFGDVASIEQPFNHIDFH
jgi:hypothetical protein